MEHPDAICLRKPKVLASVDDKLWCGPFVDEVGRVVFFDDFASMGLVRRATPLVVELRRNVSRSLTFCIMKRAYEEQLISGEAVVPRVEDLQNREYTLCCYDCASLHHRGRTTP